MTLIKHIEAFRSGTVSALLLFSGAALYAENIRADIVDVSELTREKPVAFTLGFNDSAALIPEKDTRFFRGVEIEITAPQVWLAHHGGLAVVLYAGANKPPSKGRNELEVTQVRSDVIAGRIQTVYQIPVRKNHNLRDTPYGTVLPVIAPQDFPLIIRIMPITKDLPAEVENMRFQVNARSILSDEGAAKINVRYPANLRNKPYTLLIDDIIVENAQNELLFREGEHHLMIISGDYRNESRRFLVERSKTIELNIMLQDVTPLLIFEVPDNSRVFLDNARVTPGAPRPVEQGNHEIKVQVSDYTIIKSLYVQKGKTYRVSFIVDLAVQEED